MKGLGDGKIQYSLMEQKAINNVIAIFICTAAVDYLDQVTQIIAGSRAVLPYNLE